MEASTLCINLSPLFQPRRRIILCFTCKLPGYRVPKHMMGARESNADRAAGPSAPRLDELPAEVRAEELACLLTQASRAQGLRRASDV